MYKIVNDKIAVNIAEYIVDPTRVTRCYHSSKFIECVFIYRTYHIVSQGNLQFYLSEIGRQLVKGPLAAAIRPYSHSPTQPMHEMYNETMKLQTDHNTGNYVSYLFRQVCSFFNVPC